LGAGLAVGALASGGYYGGYGGYGGYDTGYGGYGGDDCYRYRVIRNAYGDYVGRRLVNVCY
jgi:hypothetical protein